MTIRRLPPEEWNRLIGLPQGDDLIRFPHARILVAEEAGTIIGVMGLIPLWHMEGAYVAPSYRGKRVFETLFAALKAEAATLGVPAVFPGAATTAMGHFLERQGAVEIPLRLFALAARES